jgi:hypothetical protein
MILETVASIAVIIAVTLGVHIIASIREGKDNASND